MFIRFLATAVGMLAAAAPAAEKPNIIFILADDLGYGDVGCYGQKEIRTPNIDTLAREGIRFTQCYSGSTVCAPSRCVLMTGLHTGHARIRGNGKTPLDPQDVTVARVLKQAGYATGIVGKWGLGDEGTAGIPNRQGFDTWFGYLNQTHAHNYYPDFLWRNEHKEPIEGNVCKDGVASKRTHYSHDLFAAEALAFVEKHREHPFFLYLAHTIPHVNNELSRSRDDRNGLEVPDDTPYTDRSWPQAQKNQAAMITRMDADVGKLIATLKQLNLDEKTIVFFSSDNGPCKEGGADPNFFHSSGGLRGCKRDLYDGGIRVPMIARWPGRIEAARTSDYVCGFADFLPTAADLAGAKVPAETDGIPMTPSLLGRTPPANDRFLYWEFHERGFDQAVRWKDWKAVRHGRRSPIELYDIKSDPGETKNVAAAHPDVAKEIEAYLATARTESKDWPPRDEPKPK